MAKLLRVDQVGDKGNILGEDLTGITTYADKVKALHTALNRLCSEKNGVAVAANQLRMRENFFFVTEKASFPTRGGRRPVSHICLNPTWVAAEDSEMVAGIEGCLSIAAGKQEFWVGRYFEIIAEWDNVQGIRVKKTLQGFAARVFQHEHDHLRGVTLLDSGEEVQL